MLASCSEQIIRSACCTGSRKGFPAVCRALKLTLVLPAFEAAFAGVRAVRLTVSDFVSFSGFGGVLADRVGYESPFADMADYIREAEPCIARLRLLSVCVSKKGRFTV